MRNIVFLVCATFAVTACGGKGKTNTDKVNVDNSINQAGSLAEPSDVLTGSGPINSVLNGFMLSEEVICSPSGNMVSKHFYRLNAEQNEITYTSTHDENISAEEAEVFEVIGLDENGLPYKSTNFLGIPFNVEYQFNGAGRLESRILDLSISFPGAPPRTTDYSFNSAGQIESRRDLLPDGTTEFGINFTYTDGLLRSSTEFWDGSDEIITSFSSDMSGRISGWSEESILGGFSISASYLFDENNNLTDVEVYDEAGALMRTHSFTYVATESPVYNTALTTCTLEKLPS